MQKLTLNKAERTSLKKASKGFVRCDTKAVAKSRAEAATASAKNVQNTRLRLVFLGNPFVRAIPCFNSV